MIQELIRSSVVVEALESADKAAALNEVVSALVGAGAVAEGMADEVGERALAREARGSTGIGHGVAVPHAKVGGVGGMVMALARSRSGIDYDAVDGQPVHTIFFLVSPEDQADDHLAALRWVSSLARDADFRRFVLAASGEAEVRELLLEMSESK